MSERIVTDTENNRRYANGNGRIVELLNCTQCAKKDCRGAAGLHMHVQRAHTRNWSTKKKSI